MFGRFTHRKLGFCARHYTIRDHYKKSSSVSGSAARNVIMGGLLHGWSCWAHFMANTTAEWWSARLTGAITNYFSNCTYISGVCPSCLPRGLLSLPTPPQCGHCQWVALRWSPIDATVILPHHDAAAPIHTAELWITFSDILWWKRNIRSNRTSYVSTMSLLSRQNFNVGRLSIRKRSWEGFLVKMES